MNEHRCFCGKTATHEFVNPYNSLDRGYYCVEHFKAITKGFDNFNELTQLTKIRDRNGKPIL